MEFAALARRQLRKLPLDVADRLTRACFALAQDPRPPGCKKLKGEPGYRIRVGEYRIVYEIDDAIRVVLVQRAGPRKDIY